MKKIAIVGPNSYPIPAVKGGAIETLVTAIINENEKNKRLDITVYTVNDEKLSSEVEKYRYTKIVPIKISGLQNFCVFLYKVLRKITCGKLPYKNSYMKLVNELLSQHEYDAIVFETSNIEIFQYKKKKSENVFFHIHSDYIRNSTYGIKKIVNTCDQFIAVSEFIKNQLISIDGIEKENVVVLNNAIDIEERKVCDKRVAIRKKYNLSEDEIVYIYCGRLSPEKGCLELIKAFNRIQGGVLLIVGGENFSSNAKNEYVSKLYSESKTFGKRVIFTGFIPHADVFDYMAAADIAVIPSTCNEAAPLTMLEFRKAGLPTIATKIGGIPEYCNDNTTLFVEYNNEFIQGLADAMQLIMDNKDIYFKLKCNSRSDIEQFGYEDYYKRFCNIIGSIE